MLFIWFVTRTGFFKTDLTKGQLTIIFLLKVMAGIFYGWIGVYYGNKAQMVDTWSFYYYALQEYEVLKSNPGEFFGTVFANPYDHGWSNFFSSTNSFWNDLKANLMIKLVAIFDVFSFGYYYVNVIFYSYISMFGAIALFRVMNDVFPGKKMLIMCGLFLPSFLYWTSGIHKEGLNFLGIALVLYHVYFGIKNKQFGFVRILAIIFGLLLVLFLRNFVFVLLLPGVIAWIIASYFGKNKWLTTAVCYLIFTVLFFASRYFHPSLDLPSAVSNKQQEFMKLTGGYEVPFKKLEPTVAGFLSNTPQAFVNSTIRPLPEDVKDLLSLAAALEIELLLFLLILFFVFKYRDASNQSAFIPFCFFFSIAVLLSIGYTVHFLGAIVRYRSIILPIACIPMLCMIDWSRVTRFAKINIKKNDNI